MARKDDVNPMKYRRDARGNNFNVPDEAMPKPRSRPSLPAQASDTAKAKMPSRPYSPTPKPKIDNTRFNPLTSTSLLGGGDAYPGAGGADARNFGDVSPATDAPEGKRFNPLTSTYYKNGGKVRGDGMSRVKTKGRNC